MMDGGGGGDGGDCYSMAFGIPGMYDFVVLLSPYFLVTCPFLLLLVSTKFSNCSS